MAQKEATYDETQIAERLRELPGWYFEDGWIRRVYKTDGWPTTLMLVNAIGYLSEAAYHHPDLSVTWARVTVKLSTHSAGGITDEGLRARAEDRGRRALASGAGGALDGHAEQVRAERRPALIACPPAPATTLAGLTLDQVRGGPTSGPQRVLFVTGRLAEPALRRVLAEMAPPFAVRRGGDEDHGGRADDDRVDRALPAGAGGHRPRADPRPVRGRSRAHRRNVRRDGGKRAQGPARDSRAISAGPRPRASTAPGTSRSSPRSTTRRG